jgi:hypothetical protein
VFKGEIKEEPASGYQVSQMFRKSEAPALTSLFLPRFRFGYNYNRHNESQENQKSNRKNQAEQNLDLVGKKSHVN